MKQQPQTIVQNEVAESLVQRWLATEADKQRLVPDIFTRIDKISLTMKQLYESDGGMKNPSKEAVVRHFVYHYYMPHKAKVGETVCMKTTLYQGTA